MDFDEEDFVFYGTPIEREEEVASRKKKAVAEASGQLRTLPSWKQEVRDEEGRRRFHGAFTGGFSAGYFNTVGSREGWAPQSFVSSRKNRAEVKQQSIMNFLDDDEREDLEGQSLGTSSQFDTFGFTSQEHARKQAEKEQQERPSAIPGPAPDEIVLPATESIGIKLLLKMGWRRGRSIKDSHANSISDARREARKAFLAFSSDAAEAKTTEFESVRDDLENNIEQPATDVPSFQTAQVFVLSPKKDLYGLGFDPYKNAPEFRERKRLHESGKRDPGQRKSHSTRSNLFGFKCEIYNLIGVVFRMHADNRHQSIHSLNPADFYGKVAPGFGIGALEDLDAEDEDVFASEYDFEETYVQEIDEPSTNVIVDSKQKLLTNERGVLPGFRLASNAEYQPERFDPPFVPKDFVPHHKFPGPLETDFKVANASPPEVSPPEDNNLKLLIDGVATLVARCGKLFEDLSREKNQANPLFSFLLGGNGHDYYSRKLWEERQKRADQTKNEFDDKAPPRLPKLTAESRGNILGEKPLERSSKEPSSSVVASDSIQLKYNLSDTFTKPASFNEVPEIAKPFKDDPAKQERFEQFLKQKYEGGLRTTGFGGASNMSEAARARERLDFEAAAEAMEKGNWTKEIKNSTQHVTDYLASGGLQFTTGGSQKADDTPAEDLVMKKPKREEYPWRPAPILCKRFDLVDPYMGKPPPAPRMRSKIDILIFTADTVKAKSLDETGTGNRLTFAKPQSDTPETSKDVAEKEIEPDVQIENVERPVDLYKASFSDDSDDEEDTTSNVNQAEQPEKKAEAANTALSRLMAGDFLESLGKELGLEVPPDPPYSSNKAVSSVSHKDVVNDKSVNNWTLTDEDKPHSTSPVNHGITHNHETEQTHGSSAKGTEIGYYRANMEKTRHEDSRGRTTHHSSSSGSSSEDERSSRRHSRRHRRSRRSGGSESDSSSDDRERHRSRSKRKKQKSSRGKSSSSKRKHYNYDDHKSRTSPSRSRYGSEKEYSESRRDKKHRRRS